MKKRSDERQIAEWVKETCLLFGSSVQTAYTVASIFVEGLQQHVLTEELVPEHHQRVDGLD